MVGWDGYFLFASLKPLSTFLYHIFLFQKNDLQGSLKLSSLASYLFLSLTRENPDNV